MILLLFSWLTILRDSLLTRIALQAEILALRHQLLVLHRKNQKQRLRLSLAGRLLWVLALPYLAGMEVGPPHREIRDRHRMAW